MRTKKLGNISNIKTGSKDLKDKVENGIYPFYVRSQKIEKINSFSYDGEAILIPGDGRIGDIFHYINGKFDYHQRVYKISDTKEWLKFIYYLFQKNIKKHLMIYSAKATVDSLRLPMLLDFELNIPSNLEQQKIAKFFCLLDKQIELYEKKLNNYDLMYKYYLNKMFTNNNKIPSLRFKGFDEQWNTKAIKDIALKLKSGGTPKSDNKEYYNGKIPFALISDFNNKYLYKTQKFISNIGLQNSTSYIVEKGNILLSIYATIGKVVINNIDVAIPQSILGIFLNLKEVSIEFFYQLLLFNRKNLIMMQETGTQPNLNLKNISNFKITLPSILEQQKIASFFDKLDQLREKTKQTIINLNNQKNIIWECIEFWIKSLLGICPYYIYN